VPSTKTAPDLSSSRSTSLKHKATREFAALAETATASIDVCLLPRIPNPPLLTRSRALIDCVFFYYDTALIFAYIERIFSQEDREVAVESSMATLEGFLPKLRDVGFTDMVIDESFEIPRDLIRGIVDPQPVSSTGTGTTLPVTPAQLLKEFQDECSA
jgi:hypothetical protein